LQTDAKELAVAAFLAETQKLNEVLMSMKEVLAARKRSGRE